MGRAFEVRKASMMKTGLAKSKVYTKHSREIYLAAKGGVPDPESNTNLKRSIDKAKKDSVPADVIKRAIEKAKDSSGDDLTLMRYEGFGPGDVTIIVDCYSDNANRTISEVKNCFTKTDNKLGVNGSVSHMYDEPAIVSFQSDLNDDDILEMLLNDDVDISDLEIEDGIITITSNKDQYNNLLTCLESNIQDISFDVSEISMVPKHTTNLEDKDKQASFDKLIEMLNEVDDVQEIYHNLSN
ncbi:MAG: YebC/PmpR family DNA-binding transcriptional regulator [Mycoplasmatales bacterium]